MERAVFHLIDGPQLSWALRISSNYNRAYREVIPKLKGLYVHEITPVKFGGDPKAPENKLVVGQEKHCELVVFWNRQLNREQS